MENIEPINVDSIKHIEVLRIYNGGSEVIEYTVFNPTLVKEGNTLRLTFNENKNKTEENSTIIIKAVNPETDEICDSTVKFAKFYIKSNKKKYCVSPLVDNPDNIFDDYHDYEELLEHNSSELLDKLNESLMDRHLVECFYL